MNIFASITAYEVFDSLFIQIYINKVLSRCIVHDLSRIFRPRGRETVKRKYLRMEKLEISSRYVVIVSCRREKNSRKNGDLFLPEYFIPAVEYFVRHYLLLPARGFFILSPAPPVHGFIIQREFRRYE